MIDRKRCIEILFATILLGGVVPVHASVIADFNESVAGGDLASISAPNLNAGTAIGSWIVNQIGLQANDSGPGAGKVQAYSDAADDNQFQFDGPRLTNRSIPFDYRLDLTSALALDGSHSLSFDALARRAGNSADLSSTRNGLIRGLDTAGNILFELVIDGVGATTRGTIGLVGQPPSSEQIPFLAANNQPVTINMTTIEIVLGMTTFDVIVGGVPAYTGISYTDTVINLSELQFTGSGPDGGFAGYSIDNVTITAAFAAINPTPVSGAEHVDPAGTLSWNVANVSNPTFDVNVGRDSNANDVVSGANTGSVMSFTPAADLLDFGTQYFWRVDVHEGNEEYPGFTWTFTTSGKATGPDPADGSEVDRSTGRLRWQGDTLIATYDVYFGYPGSLIFIGNYSDTSVPFSDLAGALAVNRIPAGSYEWRVDTRDAGGGLMVTGDPWVCIFPEILPLVVEDFYAYANDVELADAWTAAAGATLTIESTLTLPPGAGTILDVRLGSLQLGYDNTASPWESQAQYLISPVADWSSMHSLALSFKGAPHNAPEPIYVIVDDGSTSSKVVHTNSATTVSDEYLTWNIKLQEFSHAGVDLTQVTRLTIGVGDGIAPGGSGVMCFDDIVLYPTRCIVDFRPVGDITGDCQVNLLDLGALAGDWLLSDFLVGAWAPPGGNLRALYRFEETSGTTAADSSGDGHHATVDPNGVVNYWNPDGYDGGRCLAISANLELFLPASVFTTISDEITMAFWLNGDIADHPDYVNSVEFGAGEAPVETNTWDRVWWELPSAAAYGGTWQHYAVVKDGIADTMKIYHNGVLVAQLPGASSLMSGSQAGPSVLGKLPWSRGTVKVDELQIYDAALSPEEITHLAAGSGGATLQSIEPFFSNADTNNDGMVNLRDLADLAEKWFSEF